MRPVVLLTFANQLDGYLNNLKKESANLNRIFSNLHDTQRLEVYREESSSAQTLFDALTRFRDKAVIFHYAGHADGQRVYLEDNTGDAAPISSLLASLPNLHLVFLNGCATLPQVELLFSKGVKTIIATAIPIDDEKASVFAEKFYQSLASGCDLRTSFESAVAFLSLRYGGDIQPTICRQGEYPNFSNTSRMPWGLFYNQNYDANALLGWRIPLQAGNTQYNHPNIDYDVNSYLIGVIEPMLVADPELDKMITDQNGELKDDREILSVIIENFPWTIGVQIRLLATKDDNLDTPSTERVKQLVSTYNACMQFVYFVLLSQLWEEKRKRNFPVLSTHQHLAYLGAAEFNFFDYQTHICDLVETFERENIPFFVKELQAFGTNIRDANSNLYKATQNLSGLRLQIANNNLAGIENDKIKVCADAESALADLLSELAFLTNYDLITIRDIHVMNHRHTPARFNHYIGRLNPKVSDLTVGRAPKPRAFEQFFNNASVVLTSNIQNPETYLNLSPFIVDKNAFKTGLTEDKATEQALFIYAYRDKDEYKYISSVHNIYKVQERIGDQFLTNEGASTTDPNSDDPRANQLRAKLMNRLKRTTPNQNPNQEEATVESPFAVLKTQFQIFTQDIQ